MKIAVFYYTQSGQALAIAKSICSPIEQASADGHSVVYKPIVPLQDYPYPWDGDRFFDVFPETRLGMPPSGIQPIDFSEVTDADMVLIAGQSWFLSPSLPLQSFFQDSDVRTFLKGRRVVFVNGCRNMWMTTGRIVKATLAAMGAQLVGHIVLQDEAPNLVSTLSITRWLMSGQRKTAAWLPRAGVSECDIAAASRFGEVLLQTWQDGAFPLLQNRLLAAGAIHYKPSITFLETQGHRMFGHWAQFVRRKGDFGDVQRRNRLRLFYWYLVTALFVVSPFGQLYFYLTYPLQHVHRRKTEHCGVL